MFNIHSLESCSALTFCRVLSFEFSYFIHKTSVCKSITALFLWTIKSSFLRILPSSACCQMVKKQNMTHILCSHNAMAKSLHPLARGHPDIMFWFLPTHSCAHLPLSQPIQSAEESVSKLVVCYAGDF